METLIKLQMTIKHQDKAYNCEIKELNEDSFDIKVQEECSLSHYKDTISLSKLKQSNEGFFIFKKVSDLINELELLNTEEKLNINEFSNTNDTNINAFIMVVFENEIHIRQSVQINLLEIKIDKIQVKPEQINLIDNFEKMLRKMKDMKKQKDIYEEKYNILSYKFEELNSNFEKLINHSLTDKEKEILKDFLPNRVKSFNYELLYKATYHGFEGVNFHKKVDGFVDTITIITTLEGRRFGGFTPVARTSTNGNKSDESLASFIFSLDERTKFTLKSDVRKSIFDNQYFGPIFAGNDICIVSNSNQNNNSFTNLPSCYENKSLNLNQEQTNSYLAGKKYFTTKDIEVFQLRKLYLLIDDDY